VANISHLYRDVIRAAALGLAINLALGIGKLIAGLAGDSFALIADAVNSLGDAISTVVVLFALKIAQKPADAEHPYGHSRAEAIAGSSVALMILGSAIFVGVEAVQRFGIRHESSPAWTLWIAAANIVIKEGLYQYKVRVSKRTGSSAMKANAWDHRNDALCSLAVFLGLAAVRFGGERFLWADEAASLVVVGFIIVTVVRLFRESGSELMDEQADSGLVLKIRETAQAVPGVRDVEKLWVRKSGLEYFADIHIEVDATMTVAEGHRIGHEVKDGLMETYPALRDVLVHLEPHPHEHRER